MAKTWKAGVIGCGSVAQHLHLPGYMRTPGVELVAACDPEPARHREVRQIKKDLHVYRDYREMLTREELDVISVASPNKFHAEHAVAALEHGAHVLLEKPAALSMQEIAAIKKALAKSGRQLIVGFSQRFSRGNRKLNALVRRGVIGEPYMIRIRFAHSGPYPGWAKDPWFYSPVKAGGGALLDMGIHAIDQAQWHIGPARSVQAHTATLRKKIKVEDNAVLLLEFAGGRALGYIEVGWTSPSGFNGIEVMGDEGCIITDYTGVMRLTTGRVTPDTKARLKLKTRVIDKAPTTGGWSIEIQEVVKAFRRNSNLGSGIEAGGSALAVALAAYESSRTGRRIEVATVR
ncbi:MAG: Gfo/Idh/MocA family protein [Phycisphaerae bacterium]